MEHWNITLEGKIVIFKTLTITKTVFQSLITTVSRHIVNELGIKPKIVLCINSAPKIKHETFCNDT